MFKISLHRKYAIVVVVSVLVFVAFSVHTEALILSGKPDLVVDDIKMSPEFPQEGDLITFTVRIKNQGNTASQHAVLLRPEIDLLSDGGNPEVDLTPITINTLGVGATQTISFSWTAARGSADQFAGKHTVVANILPHFTLIRSPSSGL